MCSYTEVNKNKIDAILRTDRLNQGLVMKTSGVRRYSLSKANGSPNLLLDEPKPKVKNRFVYNSISILEKPKNDSQNSFYQADKSFILNRNKTMNFNRKTELELKKENTTYKIKKVSNDLVEEKPKPKKISDYDDLKRTQRNQIYALNNLMTKLEYEHFLEFCRENNLKEKPDSDY